MSRTLARMPPSPTLRAFTAEGGGFVSMLAVVFMALLVGVGGLIWDIGRLFNVQSEMQSFADQVALAAAAELDGQGGSIARAVEAAVGPAGTGPIVTDDRSFGEGADARPDLAVAQLAFLSQLAADPADATGSPFDRQAGDVVVCTAQADGTSDCNAADDLEARFVEVTVAPQTIGFWLLPLLDLLGTGSAAAPTQAVTAARAVAGFNRQVCNAPPLMICNPYESPVAPYGGGFTPTIGQQILLKSKGTGAAWVPGDFGFLQAIEEAGAPYCTGGGNNRIRCVLGLIEPNTQCVAGTVSTKPGEGVSAHAGINVRFDMWDNNLQGEKSNPVFRPSVNVTKGKVHGANQCRSNQLADPPPAPNDTVRLPRDSCFEAGTCARFGNGVTDTQLSTYWQTNHGGTLPGSLLGGTRYDVYRHEIETNQIPNKSPGGTSSNPENGNPTCAPAGVNNPLRDRRTLVVGVINCLEHDIRGQRDDIPVVAFAHMFLTEPVGSDGANVDDVWAEMLGVAQPGGDDGVLHDFPVLYR